MYSNHLGPVDLWNYCQRLRAKALILRGSRQTGAPPLSRNASQEDKPAVKNRTGDFLGMARHTEKSSRAERKLGAPQERRREGRDGMCTAGRVGDPGQAVGGLITISRLVLPDGSRLVLMARGDNLVPMRGLLLLGEWPRQGVICKTLLFLELEVPAGLDNDWRLLGVTLGSGTGRRETRPVRIPAKRASVLTRDETA